MSRTVFLKFVASYVSAALSMLSIYAALMYFVFLNHMDYMLLAYVGVKIFLVAVLSGVLSTLIPFRDLFWAIVIGMVSGPAFGAVYIWLFVSH